MRNAALGALLCGALLAAALVVGSHVAWLAEPDDEAVIRLTWRATGERVEECREPSAEELAALPPHMRQSRICERRLLPFRLVVRIDGDGVRDDLLRAGGARADRPTTLFEDFRVAPGPHRLEILFEVEAPAGAPPTTRTSLRLDETFDLRPRQILIVTRDDDDAGGGLRIHSESAPL